MSSRPKFNSEPIIEEAKENQDLVNFIKSLTKEEIERIKQIREFDAIEKGTNTWYIALMCDSLRVQLRQKKSLITKRLWNIDDLQNTMMRLKLQLSPGPITETMKNGIVMNEFELKSLMQHNKWVQEGEVQAIYATLGEIRSLVGHFDISKKVILTMTEFDEYVNWVNESVSKYGYNLFGEVKG